MKAPSMYEALMGTSFPRLSPPVQAFHRLRGSHVLHGWVETEAPRTFLAKLMGRCLGTPLLPSTGAIRFELDAHTDHEVWVRHFPMNTMMSRMRLVYGELTESLGPTRLHFCLEEVEGRLVMRLTRLRFLGLPCPRWAMPVVIAEEDGSGDRLHFNVRASLPLVGQVAGYRGYLVVDIREDE
jgi:hypothetical protein